jgi:hypothetical protein
VHIRSALTTVCLRHIGNGSPRHRWRRVLALLLALTAPGTGAQEVIANESVNCGALSKNQARLFFTMRLQNCPNGSAVKVFVLPDGHTLHAEFAKLVLGLFPYQLRQVWDRQVFSGTGQAPTTVRSEAEMIERVATTPGAIGYAANRPAHPRVKLLEVR